MLLQRFDCKEINTLEIIKKQYFRMYNELIKKEYEKYKEIELKLDEYI